MRMNFMHVRPLAAVLALAGAICVAGAQAQQNGEISISVKDHQFDPAEVHAPANKPLAITVKNLDKVAMEFESGSLRVEKVIPAGGTGVVHVRPLSPGSYEFFDDFHRKTRGHLIVP